MEKYTQITELDFDTIKDSFKKYLKSQDEFTDYDFEGSGLSILLDLFAYNTHYNAFYLNSVVNESFLTTASKRRNIVKAAEPFSYVPRSKIGATVNVDLNVEVPLQTLINTFGENGYGSVQLQKHNRFTTTIDGETFTFVNPEAVRLVQLSDTTFQAQSVKLKQGIPNTFRYNVDESDVSQRYMIPDNNADISDIKVYLTSNTSAETINVIYYQNVPVEDVNGLTPLFFLKENEFGYYEVLMGDGKYGYKPVTGDTINIEYSVVTGKLANGSSQFTASGDVVLSGNTISDATVTVSTQDRAFGGTEKESNKSIQYYAPKYYLTQGKAVLAKDYITLVKTNFPTIESVNSWGGENNNPPKYGRIILAVKPYGSMYLTEIQKEEIITFLEKNMVATVRPEIVEPKYTYIEIDVDIIYDSDTTTKTETELLNSTTDSLLQYASDTFNTFTNQFVTSDISEFVRELDDSYLSASVTYHLKKQFVPTINIANTYTFYFQNAINYPYTGYIGSVTSSMFSYNGNDDCYIKQNSNGTLSIRRLVGGVENIVISNIGIVDYENGVVTLKSFMPSDFEGVQMDIKVEPARPIAKSKREFILIMQESDITLEYTDKALEVDDISDNTTIDTSTNAY